LEGATVPPEQRNESLAASPSRPLTHQERVAANFPLDSIEHDVALYHDHLEDGLGEVPEHIRKHVLVLTRSETEDYKTYIERVRTSGDPVAIAVKLADARDNLSRCWGANDGYLNPNLARRYEYVIEQLGGSDV
jgi:hypothetical protein